jgi:hypothetical protein
VWWIHITGDAYPPHKAEFRRRVCRHAVGSAARARTATPDPCRPDPYRPLDSRTPRPGSDI